MNHQFRRRSALRRGLGLSLAAAATLGVAASAQATYPGDNGRIVFTKVVDGAAEIHTADPGGFGSATITPGLPGWHKSAPAVDANGRVVYFLRAPGGELSLWGVNADGSANRLIRVLSGASPGAGHPGAGADWESELGVAVASRSAIGLLSGDIATAVDGELRAGLDAEPFGLPGLARAPKWSPDGTRLVFSLLPPGGGPGDIWVIDRDGGGAANLTRTPGTDDRLPNWTPDGTSIVWDGGGELRRMDADGGDAVVLAQGPCGGLGGPAVSPDGTRIAGLGCFGLDVLGIDGQRRGMIVQGATHQHVWEPSPLPPTAGLTGGVREDRPVAWALDKAAGTSGVVWNASTRTVTVPYRVDVQRRAPFRIAGTVTVTNPNPLVTITPFPRVAIPGATCSTEFAGNFTAGQTKQLRFGCDIEELPQGGLTATATVRWDRPFGSAPVLAPRPVVATAPMTIREPVLTGPQVMAVTDTLTGQATRVLAPALTDSAGFAYTADLAVTARCRNVVNTARLREGGVRGIEYRADTVTVRICPAPRTAGPGAPPLVSIDNGGGLVPVPVG